MEPQRNYSRHLAYYLFQYSCQGLDLYKTIYAALTDEGLYFNGILYIFVYGMPRADLDSYDKIITHIEDSGVQVLAK